MADRSLSFFVTIANKQNRPDSKTGMGTSAHEVQYNIKRYDKENPLGGGANESKTTNYNLVNSLQTPGQFINYQGNSTTNAFTPYTSKPEHESDIKLSSIIEWTQNSHPSMKLNVFNFAYLKDFGVYPANRLMILRRFNDGVPHDLFNCTALPISTMATYYDLETSPFTIKFNEQWDDFNESLMTLVQDVIGIKFNSKLPGGLGKLASAASSAVPSNLQQTVLEAIGQKLGLITKGDVIYGDPNIIYAAKIRRPAKKTGDDQDEIAGDGLKSTIDIPFKTTYVFREINGIDGKAAMLDIIANAINMGTSNSRFILTHNANDKLNKIIGAMQSGNVDALLNEIIDSISDIIAKSGELLASLISNVKDTLSNAASGDTDSVKQDILNVAGQIIRNRFSRYKWQLRGAVGAMTGQHTAPWHITIGNPKYPWFTIGNLVVSGVNLDFGGELSYSDMPTEVTVTITLQSGRSMGADELTSLFNNGSGRIYDTPDVIQTLKVPNDQQIIFGSDDQSTPPSSSDISNTNITTDKANEVPATTDFSLNNQETDNNLPSTKDDSKRGYTYTILKKGPGKYVQATDDSGAVIFTGNVLTSTAVEADMIQTAKIALDDL